MTRTQKEKGYRLNGLLPLYEDQYGNGNYRVVALIRLPHLGVGRHQIVISNGDILTVKFILDKEFIK